jgi:hypothetical protein
MNFTDVRTACDRFGQLLLSTTSRSYIDAISVEEPSGPEDELHFLKLIVWCYAFWFEAGHPAVKHVASLLRTSSPENFKIVSESFRSVQYLRTVRAHNMLSTSREDEYKTTQAKLWLIIAGGEPTNWQRCCRRLCEDVTKAVDLLHQAWAAVTIDDEDARSGKEQLQLAVQREWPAHNFDRLVEEAVIRVGLESFDIVAYRVTRIARWQELTKFFSDSQDAERALRRAIFRELESLFGGTGDGGVAVSPRADP